MKFIRNNYHKKKRLKPVWRKSKGVNSKVRVGKKGRLKKVKTGYGLSKTETKVQTVYNLTDLAGQKEIIIASSIGSKKKILMLKEAKKNNIKVINVRAPEEFIKKVHDRIASNKKVEKKEEKKAAVKDSIEDKISDEEKKKQEKKELDKLLTKKF